MKRILLAQVILLGAVLLTGGMVPATALRPEEPALVQGAGASGQVPARPSDPRPQSALPQEVELDAAIEAMIEQVDGNTVLDYVRELSGETPAVIGGAPYTLTTRYTYSGEPVEKATQYAAEHLAAAGLDVEYHDWGASRNVIGELAGVQDPEEIVILCAHIDSITYENPMTVAPGADDNASGAAAVLRAADILSRYRWGCTLRFALFTGEEQGLLGSYQYAQRSFNYGEEIGGVLNLDMLAWNAPPPLPLSTPEIDLHAKSSLTPTLELAQIFSDVVGVYGLDLVPEIIGSGTGASDHASFWQFDYPAILAIEDYYPSFHDFNPYYHTENDVIGYFDTEFYVELVKASLATFAHVSDCLLYPYYRVYLPVVVHEGPGQGLTVRR